MTCGDCDRCRELGYKYCNRCGADLSGEQKEIVIPTPEEKKEATFKKMVIPSMILIIIGVVADVILLITNFIGSWELVFYKTISVYLYFIYDVHVYITGLPAQIYFALMAICLIAAAAKMLYDSKDVFIIGDKDYVDKASMTPVYWIALLFGTTILIEVLMSLIMQVNGQEVVIPDWMNKMTFEEALFSYTRASVWEEIAFRVVLFGIPMMIIALILRKKDFYKYPFGGFGSSRIAMIILVISSLLFAYAHVGGWGLWKMFPTVIGGFAMGYLYMRFGIHVSIIFHGITDFMGMYMMTDMMLYEAFWLLSILFLALICYPLLAKKTYKGILKLKDMPWWRSDEPVQNDSNED